MPHVWAIFRDGAWSRHPARTPLVVGDITYPLDMFDNAVVGYAGWTIEVVEALGARYVDVTPPAGQRWTGAFEDDDGTPVAVFEPLPSPSVVTMRQARLALLGAGLLSQVDNVIDGLEEPGRSAARIEWEYATELRRGHPLVAALGSALELTEQQIDDLFLAASEIE